MNSKTDNLSIRSVVLVPLERIDAAHLVAEKFQLTATFEHHPSLAMAEVCLLNLQVNSTQAWSSKSSSIHLVLVHTKEMQQIQQMIDSIRKYLPEVRISELRNGHLEQVENHGAIIDSLDEPPIVHAESIDANELSMLLDETPQEVDE